MYQLYFWSVFRTRFRLPLSRRICVMRQAFAGKNAKALDFKWKVYGRLSPYKADSRLVLRAIRPIIQHNRLNLCANQRHVETRRQTEQSYYPDIYHTWEKCWVARGGAEVRGKRKANFIGFCMVSYAERLKVVLQISWINEQSEYLTRMLQSEQSTRRPSEIYSLANVAISWSSKSFRWRDLLSNAKL